MMRKHSDEHKSANMKTIKVGKEKKLLLFDNEAQEQELQICEDELQEIVHNVVLETFEELNESFLYEGWLEEADYPEGFSIEHFKSLPSFRKRVAYAREHLGKIGSGSARIVFAVDPNTVVKIANNKKGQAQNEIEVDVSRIGYDIIAEVKDYDPDNYLYIEMERAKKLKKSEWKRLTGYKFDDWMEVLFNYMHNRRRRQKFTTSVPEFYKDIQESDLFSSVVVLLADFGMPPGDIMRTSSWGVVNRDGKEMPVLVDYGLTQTVFDEFYR